MVTPSMPKGMPAIVRDASSGVDTDFAQLSDWCIEAPDEFRPRLLPREPAHTGNAEADARLRAEWTEDMRATMRANRSLMLNLWKHMSYWAMVQDGPRWDMWSALALRHFGATCVAKLQAWDATHAGGRCSATPDGDHPWWCARCEITQIDH